MVSKEHHECHRLREMRKCETRRLSDTSIQALEIGCSYCMKWIDEVATEADWAKTVEADETEVTLIDSEILHSQKICVSYIS